MIKPNGNRMMSIKEIMAMQSLIFNHYVAQKLQDDKFAEWINAEHEKLFTKPVTRSNVQSVREALGIEPYLYRTKAVVPNDTAVLPRLAEAERKIEKLLALAQQLDPKGDWT